MKKILLIAITGLCLANCAKEKTVYETEYLPKAGPTQQQKIDQEVADENKHRFLNGQALYTPGLVCSLYTISGGQTILAGPSTLTGKILVATYTYTGVFNQPDANVSGGMNVLPEPFKSLYKQMFYLTCSGQIVVVESSYYSFSLISDDASLLYLDGAILINGDGAHGSTTKSASKYLKKGLHTFKLDYAEVGAGNLSLILSSGGALVDSMYFYK